MRTLYIRNMPDAVAERLEHLAQRAGMPKCFFFDAGVFRSLRALCLLLSFGPDPLLIDGIHCEPLEGWLRQLRP